MAIKQTKGNMMVLVTSDSPSWTAVFKITSEANELEHIIKQYSRCLEKASGWQSKARFFTKYNTLGFDIVVYEEDFVPIKKDIEAQRKIIGKAFHAYFFDIMKKYEKKFPILKEINPPFLAEVESWLIQHQWIG